MSKCTVSPRTTPWLIEAAAGTPDFSSCVQDARPTVGSPAPAPLAVVPCWRRPSCLPKPAMVPGRNSSEAAPVISLRRALLYSSESRIPMGTSTNFGSP
jgi:hypothetical protein